MFISRRGHCQNLYCDNATNFVEAHNQPAKLSIITFSTPAQEKFNENARMETLISVSFLHVPRTSVDRGSISRIHEKASG